jgi:hypothetical protein
MKKVAGESLKYKDPLTEREHTWNAKTNVTPVIKVKRGSST